MKTDVTIIGAGLTGLSLAHFLAQQGVSVKVVEKQDRAGGSIQSHSYDGFTWESGPNSGSLNNQHIADLFEQISDNCTLEIANNKAKKRLIWKGKKWRALPSNPFSFFASPLFSLHDKFKIMGEPFCPKGTDPHESLSGMVKRRLGKSFLNYAVNPFVSGVYAGNPDNLITKYALPKLYNLEQNYGSFIKGSFKAHKNISKRDKKRTGHKVFSAKGGLNEMTEAICKSIGYDNIILNAQCKVSKNAEGYLTTANDDTEIQSKFVVSTITAPQLPTVFPFVSKDELSNITNLRYAKLVQLVAGYKNWNGIDVNAFGGLVPQIEKRNVLGILFTSSMFANRKPEQGALFSVFMGGINRPDIISLSDTEIKDIATKEIEQTLKCNKKPDFTKVYRHPYAIPQYEVSTKERLESIKNIENENEGLFIAGNLRDGISMADRVKQAYTIAEEICTKLKN